MKEPKFRCGTLEAIQSLAQELKLPYDQDMQDWSYQVAVPEDIEKYIEHYKLTSDENKKFVLMEVIIQALNDQSEKKDFLKYWERTRGILKDDFVIHEYTVFYWSCFDNENMEDTWTITPAMREVWNNYMSVR